MSERVFEFSVGDDGDVSVNFRPRMVRVVPQEAQTHFMNAGRETMLAFRELLDWGISQADPDRRTKGKAGPRRRIEVKE